jgi:hypothetical protein
VQSSENADIYAIAGIGYDASVTVTSGSNQDAMIVLRDPAQGFAGSMFEIVNKGSAAEPTLLITDGLNTMVKIEDTGDYGNMQVTGNAQFGAADITEDRVLSVLSGMTAKLEVVSGPSYDATIEITAGIDRDARLILSDISGPGAPGGMFTLSNIGSENDFPMFQVTNGVHDMISIIDKGSTGDLHVSGNGVIGGEDAVGQRMLTVQSSEEAKVDIISGDSRDASLVVTAGIDRDAIIALRCVPFLPQSPSGGLILSHPP